MLAMGALTFAFVDPMEAKQWVDEDYGIIKSDQCVPIGHRVNAEICLVTSFSVHHNRQTAIERGLEGFEFFGYALGSLYGFGEHKPGRTNLYENFKQTRANRLENEPINSNQQLTGGQGGIGTPQDMREHLRKFEQVGVDQVTFIQQAGMNRHAHIWESLELFAAEVMPEFKQRQAAHAEQKQELAP